MDRIHACLDGELAREELTADELARLATIERSIAQAAASYSEQPVPDLTGRVMAALPVRRFEGAPAASTWADLIAWAWTPRRFTFAFRPAYGLAGMAAVLVGALLISPPIDSPTASPPAFAEAVGAPRLYVQFRLEAPGASQVELAGSFTEWEPSYELRESAPGVWTALVPLEPGVHDYTFVIDGQRWVIDPYAPQVPDSFGGSNSRLFLPAPAESA